jgi:uncharacterized membrane protein
MTNAKTSLLKRLAGCFLAGLLAVLPAVLTIGIVVWVAGFIHRYIGRGTLFGKALQSLGLNFVTNEMAAYAMGWIVVLLGIFGLGLIIEMGARRFLQQLLDAAASRVPLVGSIYGTSKQLVAMFDRKNESELKAMSVVWCFFGDDGAAILALMPTSQVFQVEGRSYNALIIPTAPVPFGGALMFMPVEVVKPAEISVDALMSIYVSMGITAPQFLNPKSTT